MPAMNVPWVFRSLLAVITLTGSLLNFAFNNNVTITILVQGEIHVSLSDVFAVQRNRTDETEWGLEIIISETTTQPVWK